MRLARRSFSFTILTLATTFAPLACAAEDRASAEAAIRKATAAFVEAFNNADVATLATLWTKEGDFIGDNGQIIHFAEKVSAQSGMKDAKDRPHLGMTISNIRFVSNDVATVDGISIFKLRPDSKTVHGRYVATWTKRDNRWLIDSIRESVLAGGSHHAKLMELEWLVGEWVNAGEKTHIRTTVAWSEDQNYLIRNFTVQLPGHAERGGTQRIGWDANAGVIKSWTFFTDGGYSQSTWEEDGSAWNIETGGITAGGKRSVSSTRLTRIDADTIQWETTDASVNGVALSDIKVKLVRKTAK